MSDPGFAQLLNILEWVAFKRGKRVVKIDRWTPTTQVCSGCGQKHKLELQDRERHCECGLVIDRDHNAARNILEAGIASYWRSWKKTNLIYSGGVRRERQNPTKPQVRIFLGEYVT